MSQIQKIRKVLVRTALTAAAAAVGVMGTLTPATAADSDQPRLLLSVDGQAWAREVTTTMFDPNHVWVPEDSATYSVLFRNNSGQDAEGFGQVQLAGPGAHMFTTRLRVDNGPWHTGTQSPTVTLAADQSAQLDIELTLHGDNPRAPLTADIAATITLRGDNTTPAGDPDSGTVENTHTDTDTDTDTAGTHQNSSGEPLAITGINPLHLIALAALLCAAGYALKALRHHRRTLDP